MIRSRRLCALMLFAVTLPAAGSGKLQAGQETIVPLRYLVQDRLIAEVNVTNVTRVDVPTGNGQLTSVYVAEATIVQTITPDMELMPVNRGMAIVGSTRPQSSAVFKPIQKGRYLAFLQAEQGHYHYGMNMAFRPIDAEGNVYWYEHKEGRATEFSTLPLKKAIQRIQEVQQELAAEREADMRGATGGAEDAPAGAPELSFAKAVELVTQYMEDSRLSERHFIRSVTYQSQRESPAMWLIALSPRKAGQVYGVRIRILMDGSLHLIK